MLKNTMLKRLENFWSFRWLGIHDELAQYKSMYFNLLMTKAFIVPFLPPYFRDLGLNELQVGVLSATMPLMSLLSQPVYGSLADSTGKHALIHSLAIVLGSLLRSSICLFPPVMHSLLPMMLLANLVNAPALPFCDSSSNSKIEQLQQSGSSGWGGVRVYGAIAWALFAPASGMWQTLPENSSVSRYSGFVGHAVCALVAGCNALALEHDRTRSIATVGRNSGSILKDVAHACSSADAIVHICSFFVMALCMGITDAHLFTFLRDEGGSFALMGFALTCTCISEIPIFYVAQHIRKACGNYGTLHLCHAAYVVRYVSAF